MVRKRKQDIGQSIKVLIVVCLSCFIMFFLSPQVPSSLQDFSKRAIWVSYFEMEELSYDSLSSFKKSYNQLLKKVKKYEINTVIVHVRAFSDALYKSKVYPFSSYMSGHQSLSFDPLEEMVKMTHDEDMKFEAWINPYRISFNNTSLNQFKNSKYKSWLNSNETIHCGDNKYILNPASEKARKLIVDGVKEIVENYDVDGIHFDDYFYIENSHKNTTLESRKDNVNILIKDVYKTIKSINENVSFGISPQGNYENCINQGADIDTWLKNEGYIDYLMPQLYWTNDYDGTKLFTKRTKLFASLKRHNKVSLYAGLALYNAGKEFNKDKGWSNSSENISKQVDILEEYGYKGYSLFSYSSLSSDAGKKEMDTLLKQHNR